MLTSRKNLDLTWISAASWSSYCLYSLVKPRSVQVWLPEFTENNQSLKKAAARHSLTPKGKPFCSRSSGTWRWVVESFTPAESRTAKLGSKLEHFHTWNGSTRRVARLDTYASNIRVATDGHRPHQRLCFSCSCHSQFHCWSLKRSTVKPFFSIFSLLWTHLFLPSVSSRSTLETTPVLKSLSTAACDESKTISIYFRISNVIQSQHRVIIYVFKLCLLSVGKTHITACNVGRTLTRSSWSTRLFKHMKLW